MRYIYKDRTGTEIGPIEQDAVLQLIKDGVITSDTMIRNNMLTTFSPAGTHQALKNAFVKTAPEKLTRRRGETDYEYNRRVDTSLAGDDGKTTAFVREMNIVSGNLGLGLGHYSTSLRIVWALRISFGGVLCVFFTNPDSTQIPLGST